MPELEIEENEQEKKPRAKSNAQKKYDLFRSVGNAIRRIREEDGKKRATALKKNQFLPEEINLYVLEHVTPTRVKLANGYPQQMQIPAFKAVKPNYQDAKDLPESQKSPFQHYPNTYLIGYDTEYQVYEDELHPNYPAKMLSHQFYFNFAGHRFGVIFITEVTFRAIDLVRLINTSVPENSSKWVPPGEGIEVPELSIVRIYAHFSAIESGWMQPSMQLKSEFTDFFGWIRAEFQPLIAERDKEWHNKSLLRMAKTIDPKTKKPSKKDQWRVELRYCDSKNLSGGGSLEDLGVKIGIPKVKHEHITEMEEYLRTNKDDFCYYGMMDSIITAETHLWYNNVGRYQLELNVEKERAAGLSAELFKNIFLKQYGDDWKRYLGYNNNKMTIAHRAFVQFYHGGRNEVLAVGPKGRAVYYDLRSAYPTSLIMLPDYDFSNSKSYHGEDAERAVRRLEADEENGPFQVAGIVVSFKFWEDVPPIFPVRIDEPSNLPNAKRGYDTDGLIFPRSGHTTITWPELWVARNTPPKDSKHTNLLEKLTIHSLVTFQNLGTKYLSEKVYEILAKRDKKDKPMDSYYKQILNYFYGKTAQAVADAATSFKSHNLQKPLEISSVTCYPLASFITGFCRAAVAELLQKHECFGITTDGFISPLPDGTITRDPSSNLERFRRMTSKRKYRTQIIRFDRIKRRYAVLTHSKPISYDSNQLSLGKDSFCGRVHDRVKELNPFIGIDSQGDRSLFLKTRGYLLVTGDFLKKLARAGAQTSRVGKNPKPPGTQVEIDAHVQEHKKAVDEFLKITQRGKCDKVSWRSLPNQRKYWRAELDELYNSDVILARAKQVLTSTRIRVMHSDKGLITFSKAERLYGRITAKRQVKHTKDTLPLQVTFKDAKVNITFDMKRIPKDPVVKPFNWQGKDYKYVSFETDPLYSLMDFHLLRALADRGDSHRKYVHKIAEEDPNHKDAVYPYKQLETIKKTEYAPVPADELETLKIFLPEVSERFEQKKEIRLSVDDDKTIRIGFDAYVFTINAEIERRNKLFEPISHDLDTSDKAFIEFLKAETQRKKERAKNNVPYKPGREKEQYAEPLSDQEFEGDYEQSNEDKLKEIAEYREKISAACKAYVKLGAKKAKLILQSKNSVLISSSKKVKPISLDMTFERDELIAFLARHGGGVQGLVESKQGFVDEEPVCMELEDYKVMLREFKKVTEFGAEPTPDELERFGKEISNRYRTHPLANIIYELFVLRRKKQMHHEFTEEKNSENPVAGKTKAELIRNAEEIIIDFRDSGVLQHLNTMNFENIDKIRDCLKAGLTYQKTAESVQFGTTVEETVKAVEYVTRTKEKRKQW